MALMTQIRDNLTKLFAVLAVLFIVLIVFDWGMELPQMRSGGAGDVVGVVNGKEIKHQEFLTMLRQQVEAYRTQAGSEPDEETERYLRDQVWNTFVQQFLMDEQIDRLGISVTDREVIDIVHGPNPPEFLAQNFRDSTGRFNRAAYDQAIGDPQNREAWVQVENVIRQQRRQEKLQSLINATVRVTEGELRQRYLERNAKVSVEFVLFDPSRFFPDSTISITDEDILKHYNANQDEFVVRPARKVKYVRFQIAPSADDTAAVENEMNRLLAQTKSGMDFTELANTYSELPVNEAFFKHGELSREKESAVFSAKKGDVAGPIKDFDGFHLIKVLDERRGNDEYIRASHILLRSVAGEDSTQKIATMRGLLGQIRSGADFAELARTHSEDVGSAVQGGDLGWTGKGGWVKPFEDAAKRTRVGDVVGPVRTQFGWHLIKVTGKDRRELKLVGLTMKVKSSSQSTELAYKQAEEFAYLAESEGFEKSAQLSGYQVVETPQFVKTTPIPGIGFNETLTNFAFREDVGAISEPIGIRGGLIVAMVSEKREEGVQPFEDVKNITRTQYIKKTKMEKLKPLVEDFYNRLLQDPGTSLGSGAPSGAQYQKTTEFKPSEGAPFVGRDPAFTGVVLNLQQGQTSKPFEGLRGYYIVRALTVAGVDSATYSAESAALRDQLLQEKKNQVVSQWFTALREQATIEDYRHKFFR
ncbi:MAG: peptidylprolyl isomerase [Ignavibacteriae bacterium]|nr:peptidylprolyl isomerase [Ignavibacteriota bacterium]